MRGKDPFFPSPPSLDCLWESRANAQQRQGRAGRLRPGVCYRLYSRATEAGFEDFPRPEMMVSRLEEVILQVKSLGLGRAGDFLGLVMDPPKPAALGRLRE